jgi:multimeric flavodoxin WrbA
MTDTTPLRALYLNCTLTRSPGVSNTQGLVDRSAAVLRAEGVDVETVRVVDLDLPPGIFPDMTEHGWDADPWPAFWPRVRDADILVVAGPLWLGEQSSIQRVLIERLYAMSSETNDAGQPVFYGKVAGALTTGNEDGVKHVGMNTLYSLQHIGYTIPPEATSGWIGEIGPGPSYLDEGSGGPENAFTNRTTRTAAWNLLHLARILRAAGGIPAEGNVVEDD